MKILLRSRPFRLAWNLVALLTLTSGFLSAAPTVIDRQISREPVEQGVDLITLRQFDTQGWLNVFALEVDHTQPHLSLDALLAHERLTGPERLIAITRRRGAIGGTNGDFFAIRSTNSPLGVHLQSGELFKSPSSGRGLAIGLTKDSAFKLFLGNVSFKGEVSGLGKSTYPLSAWNVPTVSNDGIVFYNARWGKTAQGTDSADMSGWTGLVHVVLDSQHKVLHVLKDSPGPKFPDGGSVLLGRGNGAEWLLKNTRPGIVLDVRYQVQPANLYTAIGAGAQVLQEGNLTKPVGGDVHPRTAFGFNKERTRSWLMVVDGRSPLSRGVTLHDLGLIMKEFGADFAVNLDGGGSSTLVAQTPGTNEPVVQNRPSDGGDRSVPNGLGIFSSSPTGPMSKLFILPPAPKNIYAIETREIRLPPGATYRPEVTATDAHMHSVDLSSGSIQWQVEPSSLGSFSEGIFHATTAGRGRIMVQARTDSGRASTEFPIRVIGEPVKLEIQPEELSMSAKQSVAVTVNAVDIDGYHAVLTDENITWESRGGAGSYRDGIFTAGNKAGSGALIAKFGDLSVSAPVGVGDEPVSVAFFDDLSKWKTNAVPEAATSSLQPISHKPYIRNRAHAARLDYDFTDATRTRAAYVRPTAGPIKFPGRPLRLGLWVYGDGKEGWLRGQIADSANVARAIDFAKNIDWDGWRYLEAEIPPGTDYPITLRTIYVVETRPDAQYKGTIYLDELLAVNAPEIDPALFTITPEPQDPANRPEQIEPGQENQFRFVVFGDSKVEAGKPDSFSAKVLRSVIDQINQEEDVEFAIFTGDLMENDTEANYQFGKSFLERLNVPYRSIVANHEIAGTDNYKRFTEYFGDPYTTYKHANSEYIILNTARPDGLRASDPEQWPWLRKLLENSTAKNIFIATHTPVIDPMPAGKTGWTDAAEIGLFQNLLTEAQEQGKNVYVFHGHVHGFNRRISDGVQYIITAGAGSSLYLTPTKGGFFHYTVVTVKGDEVTYQVIPLLERIETPKQVEVAVGETSEVDVIGVAPGNLVRFPLQYPAAVEWIIDNPKIVQVDASTSSITGLQAGETTAEIRSGGISATVTIRVTAK